MPAGRGAATAAALAPNRRDQQSEARRSGDAAHQAGDAARPSLAVVERRRSRRRVRIALGSTALLLFGSMLGLAAFHSVLVQSQLRIDQLDQRISAEQQRQTELRLQVAQLGAPGRIIVAAGELGMVIPDDRVYLAAVVPDDIVPPPPTKGAATATTKAPTTTAPAPTTGTAGSGR